MNTAKVSRKSYKLCKFCGIEKSLTSFPRNGSNKITGKIYYQSLCYVCRSKIYSQKVFESPLKIKSELITEKICPTCQITKSLEGFSKDKTRRDGRTSQCKNCVSVFQAINRQLLKKTKICRICKKHFYAFKSTVTCSNACSSSLSKERNSKHVKLRRARQMKCEFSIAFDTSDIIKRDNLTCYLCYKNLSKSEITLDHILPLVRGGHHKPENIKLACEHCNKSKGTKTLTEFKKWRGDYAKYRPVTDLDFTLNKCHESQKRHL